MTGHTPWSEIKHKRRCRRCNERAADMGIWCKACVLVVCCNNYPAVRPGPPGELNVLGYAHLRQPAPRYWTTCVHRSGRGHL